MAGQDRVQHKAEISTWQFPWKKKHFASISLTIRPSLCLSAFKKIGGGSWREYFCLHLVGRPLEPVPFMPSSCKPHCICSFVRRFSFGAPCHAVSTVIQVLLAVFSWRNSWWSVRKRNARKKLRPARRPRPSLSLPNPRVCLLPHETNGERPFDGSIIFPLLSSPFYLHWLFHSCPRVYVVHLSIAHCFCPVYPPLPWPTRHGY